MLNSLRRSNGHRLKVVAGVAEDTAAEVKEVAGDMAVAMAAAEAAMVSSSKALHDKVVVAKPETVTGNVQSK